MAIIFRLNRSIWGHFIIPILLVGLSSCRGVRTPTVEIPVTDSLTDKQSPEQTSSGSNIDIRRTTDVKEVYPFAETRALLWNKDAYFVGVVPSKQTGANIGRMPAIPGWFFKFKAPGTLTELYLQIVGHGFGGQHEAAPILFEPLPYIELAIDIDEIELQATDVLQYYLSEKGRQGLEGITDPYLDFRLIHLEGDPNPVWSLYTDSLNGVSLLNLDAVTGEEVRDPFAQYE